MVADDDFSQRELYVELFSQAGFDVIAVKDGLEGLEKALSEKPDLVFTGIIMPRMDGFELIRNLRNNVALSHIPVIMFSHLGREEDRVRARKFPLTHFMVKGYNTPSEILAKVNELLNPRQPVVPEQGYNNGTSGDWPGPL